MYSARPITEPLADVYVIRWRNAVRPRANRFKSRSRHVYQERVRLGQVVLVLGLHSGEVWVWGQWHLPVFATFTEAQAFYRDYTLEIE